MHGCVIIYQFKEGRIPFFNFLDCKHFYINIASVQTPFYAIRYPGNLHYCMYHCTKPLSTIQCNKTLCRDQLVPILLIG